MTNFWQAWRPRQGAVLWGATGSRACDCLMLAPTRPACRSRPTCSPYCLRQSATRSPRGGQHNWLLPLVIAWFFGRDTPTLNRLPLPRGSSLKHWQKTRSFSSVTADVPAIDLRTLTGLYASHQYTLLSAADRQLLQGGSVDLPARLQRKLYAPFQFGLALPLVQDPFGLRTIGWPACRCAVSSSKPDNGPAGSPQRYTTLGLGDSTACRLGL